MSIIIIKKDEEIYSSSIINLAPSKYSLTILSLISSSNGAHFQEAYFQPTLYSHSFKESTGRQVLYPQWLQEGKSKLQRGCLWQLPEGSSWTSFQGENPGYSLEQREPSYTAGGYVNW